MIQDKIFFDEKDPTGVSYNTPFTVYGSYQGRLWSKTPTGSIKYYTQNSDLSVYATTGSNSFNGNQTVTGSLTVTEGIIGTATTASYVEYAGVANKPTLVSSSAQIVGYNIFATTGSNQFNGSQAITGSLTVTGQVVAQTLNVQQVTSSIVFSSGSNIFGNSLGNTQQFTGSLQVSGSSHYVLGNVGIGATSSAVLLSLGKIGTANQIGFYDGATAKGFIGIAAGTSDIISTDALNDMVIRPSASGNLLFAIGSTERMRITSGGNVGIGVSPSSRLHVKGTGSDGLTLERSAASQDVFIKFQNENGVDVWQQLVTGTAQDFSLTRLGGSGNILLGSTGGKVVIGKTSSTGGPLQISDGTNMLNVDSDANGPYITAVNNANTVYKRMTYDATEHVFLISAGERVRVTSNGLTFNGDTAAANALDDYEEGNWTPAASYTTSNGNLAYAVQFGTYVKVGKVVNCVGYLLFSEDTASGNLRITGLPFPASSAANYILRFGVGVDNLTGLSGMPTGEIGGSGTLIGLSYTGTGSATVITNANTGGNAVFRMTFSYITD